MDEPKASRRELTKAQNREVILTAARSVFVQLGFAKATVRDVIRATPLASGTFYNYFKSKEEVYQALRDEAALAVRPSLRAARLAATTAEEFLSSGFRAFFAFSVSRHDAGAVTVNACGALRSGWSKQAQTRRAASGSNEVQT